MQVKKQFSKREGKNKGSLGAQTLGANLPFVGIVLVVRWRLLGCSTTLQSAWEQQQHALWCSFHMHIYPYRHQGSFSNGM